MPKLVCSAHKRELVPTLNGVNMVEFASFGPYRLWQSDEWSCPVPGCSVKVIPEAGTKAIEHYQTGFAERLAWALLPSRQTLLRLDFESEEQRESWEPRIEEWLSIFNATHPAAIG